MMKEILFFLCLMTRMIFYFFLSYMMMTKTNGAQIKKFFPLEIGFSFFKKIMLNTQRKGNNQSKKERLNGDEAKLLFFIFRVDLLILFF